MLVRLDDNGAVVPHQPAAPQPANPSYPTPTGTNTLPPNIHTPGPQLGDGSSPTYTGTSRGGGNSGSGGGTGSGGGGGGGTTTSKYTPPGGDYSGMLGIYGLPSDVMSKVDEIFQNVADVNQAAAIALAYIRSTSWYAQTYPGIQTGIQKGLLSNEADYRNYVNQVNQYTQQYFGRQATAGEIAGYLGGGYNPGHVGDLFKGQAYVAANRPELQYLAGAFGQGRMSSDQLTALGNENAGIDTQLGQLQQKIINRAQQIQQKISTGTLGTPSLSLGTNGLSAPSLTGTKATPDVAS